MATDTVSANSLIREKVANMLVQPLEASSVILNAGTTIFDSSEPLRIPTIEEGVSPEWVGENELIPEDEVTTGEISLMPSDRKSIKIITRVSNELIRQATMGVSGVLESRLVADVRNKLDTALLEGDGADNSILGLVNQPNVTTGVFDASDPDSVIDAIGALNALEVNPTRLIVSGADFTEMRKLKDNSGRYLLTPDISAGAVGSIHGIPVSITNKLEAGTAVLADMSAIAVVRDIDPRVDILKERYADYDQTGIRVVTRYDLGLIRPNAVAILTAV